MSKINAELWKEIQNNIYPDPHKTHEAIYAIVQSQITLAQQRTEKKRDEEIIKMLWFIHKDEVDEESETYNEGLDRAIFKIQERQIADLLK